VARKRQKEASGGSQSHHGQRHLAENTKYREERLICLPTQYCHLRLKKSEIAMLDQGESKRQKALAQRIGKTYPGGADLGCVG
jgi:hypothetical protein